jgi:uncharacterized protein
MSTLTPAEKHALTTLRRRLRETFADRFHTLQLFGSKARGEATKFSDVDVLIVLDHASWPDRRAVSRLTADLVVQTGIVISPKVFSPKELAIMKAHRSMFWQSIQPDLIPL